MVSALLLFSILPAGVYAQSARAHDERGWKWYEQGEYDKAIVEYNLALKLDPSYGAAYNDRGLAWTDKGEYSKALAWIPIVAIRLKVCLLTGGTTRA
jgi:tetratricopeptide (TPR) repeat protein